MELTVPRQNQMLPEGQNNFENTVEQGILINHEETEARAANHPGGYFSNGSSTGEGSNEGISSESEIIKEGTLEDSDGKSNFLKQSKVRRRCRTCC